MHVACCFTFALHVHCACMYYEYQWFSYRLNIWLSYFIYNVHVSTYEVDHATLHIAQYTEQE